jgi:hypothetical protein
MFGLAGSNQKYGCASRRDTCTQYDEFDELWGNTLRAQDPILLTTPVPYRCPDFVGREMELEKMGSLLPGPENNQKQAIHLLRGPSGVGKSQIALAFANKHAWRYV